MNEKDTGGPAFPRVVEQPNGYMKAVEGMTLLDYFAAKAMQALLSDPEWRTGEWKTDTATTSYKVADAMLKARGESK